MSLRQGSCAWALLRVCSQQVGSEGSLQQRKELGKGLLGTGVSHQLDPKGSLEHD